MKSCQWDEDTQPSHDDSGEDLLGHHWCDASHDARALHGLQIRSKCISRTSSWGCYTDDSAVDAQWVYDKHGTNFGKQWSKIRMHVTNCSSIWVESSGNQELQVVLSVLVAESQSHTSHRLHQTQMTDVEFWTSKSGAVDLSWFKLGNHCNPPFGSTLSPINSI